MPADKVLVDARAAAELLSISERSLWSLTKSGAIPCVRLGDKLVRYSPDVLREWAKEQSNKNTAGAFPAAD